MESSVAGPYLTGEGVCGACISSTGAHGSPGHNRATALVNACSNIASFVSSPHASWHTLTLFTVRTKRAAVLHANAKSVITVIFNRCLNSIWGQFQALQIMYYYNRRKVFFKWNKPFAIIFSFLLIMWIDFFLKKELQQLELWNSPSNRSEPYFPSCVVQHERLPGLSQDFPPQGTPRGSFLSEKKDPLTEPILELTNGAFHGEAAANWVQLLLTSLLQLKIQPTKPCLIHSWITGHFHAWLAVLRAW